MLKAGTYQARIKDYGITETARTHEPQLLVVFTVKDDEGNKEDVTWRGLLREGKPKEITIDNIVKMGFVGNDLSAMADGVGNGALDPNRPFEVVIEMSEYEGKTYPQIKYVNNPGEAHFQRMDKVEAIRVLSGMNLSGDLAAARAKKTGGAQVSQPAPHNYAPGANNPPSFNANDNVPF